MVCQCYTSPRYGEAQHSIHRRQKTSEAEKPCLLGLCKYKICDLSHDEGAAEQNITIQPLVMSTIDNTYAPCTDFPNNAVMTERFTNELGRNLYSRILGRVNVQVNHGLNSHFPLITNWLGVALSPQMHPSPGIIHFSNALARAGCLGQLRD